MQCIVGLGSLGIGTELEADIVLLFEHCELLVGNTADQERF